MVIVDQDITEVVALMSRTAWWSFVDQRAPSTTIRCIAWVQGVMRRKPIVIIMVEGEFEPSQAQGSILNPAQSMTIKSAGPRPSAHNSVHQLIEGEVAF